jgi:hypothetical protein
LTPSVTTDAQGKPKVTFGLTVSGQPGRELEEVLAAPSKIATQGKRRVVMVLDEVQQMLEYESDAVERRLRSVIQKQQDVAYIFLGSRKHLIQKMFLDRSRPLYRAAGHYPLGPIETAHWIPFIGGKFRDGDRPISEDVIQKVCNLTHGHPFYTQHVCHAIWELCEPGEQVTESLIEAAVKVLLDREKLRVHSALGFAAFESKETTEGPCFRTGGRQTILRHICPALRLGICFEFPAGGREFAQSRSH